MKHMHSCIEDHILAKTLFAVQRGQRFRNLYLLSMHSDPNGHYTYFFKVHLSYSSLCMYKLWFWVLSRLAPTTCMQVNSVIPQLKLIRTNMAGIETSGDPWGTKSWLLGLLLLNQAVKHKRYMVVANIWYGLSLFSQNVLFRCNTPI